MTLGGMVAEHEFLSEHSDGAVADLAQASTWAAAMVGSYGMGGRLITTSVIDGNGIAIALQRDHHLADTVDSILKEQRTRAAEIVERYRDVIEELAERLLHDHRVGGHQVTEMVRRSQRSTQLALAI